ncbi:uncharacterized protein LOC111915184 isoform X1 [Lactuca sativa]|uniref:uncharacterized protein LOC111915184 isoform X1 n=1 Tax=Lactuca sativa TaxID=4236 RepID=UPI000CD98CBF|nr:uncharacterized protein LOC111915184 isoform X1 [Lactuca sativa]
MESSSGGVIVSKGMQNPFTLKVGKVFTGFGVGCGAGIGVGRPINLGNCSSSMLLNNTMKFGGIFKPTEGENHDTSAIPVLNQVMGAARGATDIFSGVGRHANNSLNKVGAKNIKVGIGCGVGFGHGFGVGLGIKPWVLQQIQTSLVQTATKLMMKFGMTPNLSSVTGGMFPQSLQLQSGSKTKTITTTMTQENVSSKPPLTSSYANHTEKVINNFLKNPLLEGEAKNQVGPLHSKEEVIELVLKQQLALEKLKEENEKLREILVEDLKVSPDKFKVKVNGYYSGTNTYTCNDCLECRRRQRRDRRK